MSTWLHRTECKQNSIQFVNISIFTFVIQLCINADTRDSHTLSPNDMRCCCSLLSTPCGVAELEELQIRISTKPNSAHASKRKLSRPVANSLIWLKEARSKLDKKRTVKAISISISVDPDPLARCVVPRLQTATDCAARKGHAVWQCQPVWRRQVCRRTSVPVCLWLSLYLCVSECVCVCMSASVCVCACLGVGVLPHCFGLSCRQLQTALHTRRRCAKFSLRLPVNKHFKRATHSWVSLWFLFCLLIILIVLIALAKFNYVYSVNAGKFKLFKEVSKGYK